MTQENLLDAVVDDLKGVFTHDTLTNSQGVERTVQVYRQNLPIREGTDEEPEAEEPPEPYVLVRLCQGELPAPDTRQKVDVVLTICVVDQDPNRQGYRDALHIVNSILTHYGENNIVGRRYEVQYPIKWATQEEESHPYYFAAVALTFEAPAIFKEVPET